MSIVRVGLAETKNFAEGYDAIFGKKPAGSKKTTAKPAKAAAKAPKAAAKAKPAAKAKKKPAAKKK